MKIMIYYSIHIFIKNKEYENAIYSLPTDKELKSINITAPNIDFFKR